MAYATYTTKAIVCGCKDSYTSDRSYLLFTEEAGMLWATARSVREERSKQRQALQEFSLVRVSLVKGKTGWRIGSVESTGNTFLASSDRHVRTALTSVVKFLRRFLQGEEGVEAIFADTEKTLATLPQLSQEESVLVVDRFRLRSLYQLGYIVALPSYKDILQSPDWTHALTPLPGEAEKAISRGLESSHL